MAEDLQEALLQSDPTVGMIGKQNRPSKREHNIRSVLLSAEKLTSDDLPRRQSQLLLPESPNFRGLPSCAKSRPTLHRKSESSGQITERIGTETIETETIGIEKIGTERSAVHWDKMLRVPCSHCGCLLEGDSLRRMALESDQRIPPPRSSSHNSYQSTYNSASRLSSRTAPSQCLPGRPALPIGTSESTNGVQDQNIVEGRILPEGKNRGGGADRLSESKETLFDWCYRRAFDSVHGELIIHPNEQESPRKMSQRTAIERSVSFPHCLISPFFSFLHHLRLTHPVRVVVVLCV